MSDRNKKTKQKRDVANESRFSHDDKPTHEVKCK